MRIDTHYFLRAKVALCTLNISHSVKIKEVYDALERFAPLPLQEDWDNAGLQVGLTEAEVSGALLCLDVTEEIVREAMAKGCNLIVSHHPLIFRKLAQVSGTDMVQRAVILAIKNDITIISMHTNLDSALGGVNHEMAKRLGLKNIGFLNPQQMNGVEYGMGTIGELPSEICAEQVVELVKKTFNCGCVITNPLIKCPIRYVAVMGGAGDCAIGAAEKAGADAFITGEMHYHQYFDHDDIQLAVIGHYESEQFTQHLLKRIIERDCAGVECYIAETQTNPLRYH